MSLDLALWIGLGVLVLGMLALDLFVFHRAAHEVSMREAAIWSAVWIALGLGFGGVVFATRGSTMHWARYWSGRKGRCGRCPGLSGKRDCCTEQWGEA